MAITLAPTTRDRVIGGAAAVVWPAERNPAIVPRRLPLSLQGRGLASKRSTYGIMRIGRFIAFLFLFIASAILGRDGLASLSEGSLALLPLGELWFNISPGSLNALQAGVERYVSVRLWDSVLTPMLHVPAFLYPLVIGLAILVFAQRGERR